MNQKKELYIPVNTPDSDDYISGIGRKEVTIIFISLLFSVFIGIGIISITSNMINAVLTGAIIISSTIVIFKRDIYNENLIKKILILYSYHKSPKKYVYTYFNIYEMENE